MGSLRRRARQKIDQLLEIQGNICGECKEPMNLTPVRFRDPNAVTIDHIIRIVDGGRNNIENLELVHYKCNQIRNDRMQPPKIKFCRICRVRIKTKSFCKKCQIHAYLLAAGVGLS